MPLKHIFIALSVVTLWAGNYAFSAIGIASIPPFLYGSLRFAIVAVILMPFAPRLSFYQIQRVFMLAFVLVGVHMTGLLIAIKMGLDIATCALIAQLGVPFSCMLGVFFLKETIGRWRLLGLMLAFCGMVVVMDSPHLDVSNAFWIAIFAAFAWAVSNLQLKAFGQLPIMHLLAWLSLISSPFLFAASYAFEGNSFEILGNAPIKAYTAVVFTAIGSTIAGYGCWYYLIKQHAVNHVAPFSLLVPLLSAFFGVVFLDEEITSNLITGGLLTMLGIALIIIRKPNIASA